MFSGQLVTGPIQSLLNFRIKFVKIGILDGMLSRPPQTLHGIMWMASSLLNLTLYQYQMWLHLGK